MKSWSALGSSYCVGLTGQGVGMELAFRAGSSSQESVSAGNDQVSSSHCSFSCSGVTYWLLLIFMKTL